MGGEKQMSYVEKSALFKALGDPTRLEIVDMVACGELCACKIFEKFDITQPSLSHHMKILCDCGLVSARKDGKWTCYSLDEKAKVEFKDILARITSCDESCECYVTSCCDSDCCADSGDCC